MTTAAKPTYFPARGGTGRTESDLGALSKQYSSRDLPSHTKIKYRQEGQGSAGEIKSKDFKKDLEEKDRAGREAKKHLQTSASGRKEPTGKDEGSRRQKSEPAQLALLDADDPTVNDDDDDDVGLGAGRDDGSDDDDDEGDDLEMELNKIRREREAEKARLEEERKAEEERVRIENILSGNPLLNAAGLGGPADFRVKRRWDDDVVFKNCAREDDSKKPRHYVNDTLRSEFHKKFMDKYIK